MGRRGNAPITFDAEKGVLLYPSFKAPRCARVGVPYKSQERTDGHVTECILLGIVDCPPENVTHVRVRTISHGKRASDRIVVARGFFTNYVTEPVELPKPPPKTKPQVPVTVDAIAMLDLADTLTKVLEAQLTTNELLRQTNDRLAQLVDLWSPSAMRVTG